MTLNISKVFIRENSLYLIFNNVDAYIEENNENKYLIFGSTDKNKEALENYTNFGMKLKIKLSKYVLTNKLSMEDIS